MSEVLTGRSRARHLLAYGRAVSITAPDELLVLMHGWLAPSWQDTDRPAERAWALQPRGDRVWEVKVDREVHSRHATPRLAAHALVSDLELWIAENAHGVVLVHAGCVVQHGRAIVLPGFSLAGKSTLTLALLNAGAELFSDEYAVLSPNGLVSPHARALSLRQPGGADGRRTTAAELGATTGRGNATVDLVAFLCYDPQRGWDTAPLTRPRGAAELLTHAVCARAQPDAALTAVARASARAGFLVGTRGEAGDAAERLLNLLSPTR